MQKVIKLFHKVWVTHSSCYSSHPNEIRHFLPSNKKCHDITTCSPFVTKNVFRKVTRPWKKIAVDNLWLKWLFQHSTNEIRQKNSSQQTNVRRTHPRLNNFGLLHLHTLFICFIAHEMSQRCKKTALEFSN